MAITEYVAIEAADADALATLAAIKITAGYQPYSHPVTMEDNRVLQAFVKGVPDASVIASASITTLSTTDVDAGASGTAGSVDIFPGTGSKGKLHMTVTDQTGDTTVSLVTGAMASARTITLRDPGAAASLLTTTDATAAATTATAVELTMAADTSVNTEIVTATNVITAAESGATFFLNAATEFVSTLPAVAQGLRYSFIVTAAPSGASYTVVTNASANIIKGQQLSAAGDAGDTGTADDTITFVDGQSVAGDRCDVICDGTNWFAYARSAVAAGITFTQAT